MVCSLMRMRMDLEAIVNGPSVGPPGRAHARACSRHHVEQKNFGIVGARDGDCAALLERDTVARPQFLTIDGDGTGRHLDPTDTAGLQVECDALVDTKDRRIKINALVDGDGTVAAIT